MFDDYLESILIAIVFLIAGFIQGLAAYDKAQEMEIEKHNYIRLNGIYYYPEEVINNDK